MQRRDILKVLGLGGLVGGVAGGVAGGAIQAWRSSTAPAASSDGGFRVGSLDLSTYEIIDTHVHPTQKLTLTQSYDNQIARFAQMTLPSDDFPEKTELNRKLAAEWREHQYDLPRRIGYFNYVARSYGVQPTAEDFDAIIRRNIDQDFGAYVRAVLDREKISCCVFQVRNPESQFPTTDFPPGRFVWTLPIIGIIQPDWAKNQGATTLADAIHLIDTLIDEAVANGCAGFKSAIANYRTLDLQPVSEQEAEAAFQVLLAAQPNGYRTASGEKVPVYSDAGAEEALRQYQDFLLKHLFVKAGQLERPILIHIAVALNPDHRPRWQDPNGLYSVLENDDIRRADTRFVLLHTGFPAHQVVASMLSQFTNVFADVSFFSKFPGVLEDAYRMFLSLAPSNKIMHGSDSNDIPEEIGYCADNSRRALTRVLNDFRAYYGWTESDCENIATNVLSRNARRVFKITT